MGELLRTVALSRTDSAFCINDCITSLWISSSAGGAEGTSEAHCVQTAHSRSGMNQTLCTPASVKANNT